MDPYLPGLSGDEGSCLSFLNSIGLKLKEGERWRTLSELSEGEEKLLLNSLTPYVRGDLSRLIGEVYELVREEEGSPLRDAREFSTLLNACGRMGRQDLSFSVLFGDRSERLREAEQVMLEYRMKLASYMEEVLRGDRVRDLGPFRFVDGSGLVEWDMLGPLASMLGSVREFEGKPVVALSPSATRGCFSSPSTRWPGRCGSQARRPWPILALRDKRPPMTKPSGTRAWPSNDTSTWAG